MFEIVIEKFNNEMEININGNYSIATIDMAFRDICVYLKSLLPNRNSFLDDPNGSLRISVSPYKRELTENETFLIKLNIMPIEEVKIENIGFDFETIRELMHQVYQKMPNEYKKHFMFIVDFQKLTVF